MREGGVGDSCRQVVVPASLVVLKFNDNNTSNALKKSQSCVSELGQTERERERSAVIYRNTWRSVGGGDEMANNMFGRVRR